MSLVDTRVIEGTDDKWIAQYYTGFGWDQMGDSFDTEEEAKSFLDDQIDSADYNGEDTDD